MQETLRQYRAVRDNIGVIDRSDTGKIAIAGADRFTWLQGMVSNDVQWLARPGVSGRLKACVLDPTGHIVSDLAIINIPERSKLASILGYTECLLLDLPASNTSKLLTLFDRYLITEDVDVKDVTYLLACVSLQGPLAEAAQEPGFAESNDPLRRVKAEPRVGRAADHTGSGGMDIYFETSMRKQVLADVLDHSVPEIEADAQELLRIEAGIPKYGVDMDETTLAPEANLTSTHISLTKGCYVGQEVIARIDSRGHTNRALTGLLFPAGGTPAMGAKIFAPQEGGQADREVGWVTSAVCASPAMHDRPIALAYVRHENRGPGTTLRIGPSGQSAVVTELPFYRRATP